MAPIPTPKCVSWSPLGILHNGRCILSILTDVGGFFLYNLQNYEYSKKISVSNEWLQHCKKKWTTKVNKLNVGEKLEELKARTSQVKLTAVSWLNTSQNGVGWLATASKSGVVALWRVEASVATHQDLTLILIMEHDTELRNIVRIHWTTLTSRNTLLTVAALDGRVLSLSVSPVHDNPTVLGVEEMWAEQDRIASSYLTSWSWCTGLVLAVVKGAFVITFYLTSDGQKISYAAYRSCDVSVNGLTKVTDDKIMVVTRSCKFTSLTLSLTNGTKLELTVKDVESYINISHMGCYSVDVTMNSVLCFIMLSVNQAYDHLLLREPTQVVICSLAEPQAHLENFTRPASDLADCLELLRVQILRKVHPKDLSISIADLNAMSQDQLVIVFWRVTFALNVEENESQQKIWANLQHQIETLAVSCHFFKRITFLLGSSMDSFFHQSGLGLLSQWLKKLCELPEEFLNVRTTGAALSLQVEKKAKQCSLNFDQLETCDICGDEMGEQSELFFSKCRQNHRLPRCSLSLAQCSQLPYYVCSQCGLVAHPLAVEECGINCILCCGILRLDTDIL